MRRPSPIVGIFLTVLIDMLSFGMLIPDLQVRGRDLGASATTIGLLLASFSIAQLLTSPFLGRLSDKIGRRKVLVVTCLLSAISFAFYANANHLWEMFASRIVGGIAAANLGVAFAYIADVTKPEERAQSLGKLGAAFGIGFVVGPPLGAWLVSVGNGSPAILGYAACALAIANFLFVYLYLTDSPIVEELGKRENAWAQLVRALSTPGLGFLLILFFVANYAFANLESTYFLLTGDVFKMSQMQGAYVLTWVGIVIAFTQGFLVQRYAKQLGEVRMMRIGYGLLAPGLILVPFSPPWGLMLIVATMLGLGNGLVGPSVNALISRSAPGSMQGGIFGITQSLGALARILGPLTGQFLYAQKFWHPYLAGSLLTLFPLVASFALNLSRPSGNDDGAAPAVPG